MINLTIDYICKAHGEPDLWRLRYKLEERARKLNADLEYFAQVSGKNSNDSLLLEYSDDTTNEELSDIIRELTIINDAIKQHPNSN